MRPRATLPIFEFGIARADRSLGPPACTGWTTKGTGVLVAVAGSFSDGSSEDLLKRSDRSLASRACAMVRDEIQLADSITHATPSRDPISPSRKDFTSRR